LIRALGSANEKQKLNYDLVAREDLMEYAEALSDGILSPYHKPSTI